MKKAAFVLILTFLVFACTSYNTAYENKLNYFLGKNEQTLINSFGRPTSKKINGNGQTVVTYLKKEQYFVPTEYFYDDPGWIDSDFVYDPFWADGDFAPYAQIIDSEVEEICQTSFVIENNIVTNYSFRGNDCR